MEMSLTKINVANFIFFLRQYGFTHFFYLQTVEIFQSDVNLENFIKYMFIKQMNCCFRQVERDF